MVKIAGLAIGPQVLRQADLGDPLATLLSVVGLIAGSCPCSESGMRLQSCDSYQRSSEGYADSPKKNGQHTCGHNGSYNGG